MIPQASFAQPRVAFGQQLSQPSASRPTLSQGSDSVKFGEDGGSTGSSKGAIVKKGTGILATAALALGIIGGVGGIRHEGSQEACVTEDYVSGQVHNADKSGLRWEKPFGMSNTECFSSAKNRVTFEVNVTPYGQAEVTVPVSFRMYPNEENLATSFKDYMDYAGVNALKGTNIGNDDDGEVKNDNNLALIANVYTEINRAVDDAASLIPPDQLRQQSGKDALADALANGYVPAELFAKFAPTLDEETLKKAKAGEIEGSGNLYSPERVPSIQELANASFDGLQVLDILDPDPKKVTFKNGDVQTSYDKAAKVQAERLAAKEELGLIKQQNTNKIEDAKGDADAAIERAKGEATANNEAAKGYDTPAERAAAKARILEEFAKSGKSSYLGSGDVDLTIPAN